MRMEERKSRTKGFRRSRRAVLRGGAALLGTAASSVFLPRYGSTQEKVVNLLSWPGWGHPETVGDFEAKHGIKVQVKEYTGGENMLALLHSSPVGTFDIILTGAAYVQMMIAGGLIEKLDPADYPFDDYWPEFQHFNQLWDGDDLYSVMVRFGYLGLAYNTQHYAPKDLGSYGVCWDAKAKGNLGFFDWYLPSMGVLSLYNGNRKPHNIDDAAFAKLKETMASLHPQVAGFYSYANTFSSLANQQIWLIPGIGEWLTLGLRKDGAPIDTFIPDEGGTQWTESFSIPKGARRPDLAKKLTQYFASAEGQVRCALRPGNNTGIPSIKGWEKLNSEHSEDADWLRMRLDKRNMMDEHREGKIALRSLPTQQTIEEWTEAWAEFKSI